MYGGGKYGGWKSVEGVWLSLPVLLNVGEPARDVIGPMPEGCDPTRSWRTGERWVRNGVVE